MESWDAFLQNYKAPKRQIAAEDLPADTLVKSGTMSNELQDSQQYDELGGITSKLSPDGMDIINSNSFIDPEGFASDYVKLTMKDKELINTGVGEGHMEAVGDITATRLANDLSTNYDLGLAKGAINKLRIKQKESKKLKDPTFQTALQMTDQDWNSADNLYNRWHKFNKNIRGYNSNFIWNMAEKELGREIPLDENITGKSDVPTDIRYAASQGYSDKVLSEIISKSSNPKEAQINYAIYLKQARLEEYGIPLNYEPDQIGDELGATRINPIFDALAVAGTGGATAAGKLAYLGAGFVGSTGVDTALDYVEDLPDNILVKGGASVALILSFALGEVGVAKSILKSKKAFIKSGNMIQFGARAAKALPSKIKLAPDMMDGVFQAIFKKAPIAKAVASPSEYAKLAEQCVPYVPTASPSVHAFEVGMDNVDRVKYATKALEAQEFKQNVKGFQKQIFGGYETAVQKMLDEDNLQGALKLWENQVDEAYEYSSGVVANTKFDFNVEPQFLQRAWNGLAPKELRDYGVYIPNSLVATGNSLDNTFNKFVKYVDRDLSRTDEKILGRLIHEVDSGVPLSSMPELSEGVATAYAKYRKVMTEGVDTLNGVLEKQYDAAGIMQYKDAKVNVGKTLKDGTIQVTDLESGVISHATPQELSKVVKPIKELDGYMKRVDKSNHIIWTKDAKGNFKVAKTVLTRQEAYLARNELIDSGGEGIILRPGQSPEEAWRQAESSSMVLASKERLANLSDDMEKVMDQLSRMGTTKADAIEASDDLMQVLSDNLNWPLSRVKKAYKAPGSGIIKKRSRDTALGKYGEGNIGDWKESMNAWSTGVARVATDSEYIYSMKQAFMDNYGKFLKDPKDYTSKIQIADDLTGSMKQAGKIVQRQIMNMERIPTLDTIALRDFVDKSVFKFYGSKNPAVRAVGYAWDKAQQHVPFSDTMRGAGYTMKMCFSPAQVWKQASFAAYGAVAHADLFLKNPSMMKGAINNARKFSQAFALEKAGKSSWITGSDEFKALYNEIKDAGYVSDLLGTEYKTNMGLLKSVTNVGMKPIVLGEFSNRIMNISTAFEVAKKEGLKFGTQEHRAFVSTYYSKYSQVLNQLTNSPLTMSAATSWNVGAFMKFQVNFFNHFWFETTKKQKVMLSAGAYTMFGPEGMPGMSDVWEAGTMVADNSRGMKLQMEMGFIDWAYDINNDTISEFIDDIYMSDEDKAAAKASVKGRGKTREDLIKHMRKSNLRDAINLGGDLGREIKRAGSDFAEATGKEVPPEKDRTWDQVLKELPETILNWDGLADDLATQIGFSSRLRQMRDFGYGSALAGPAVQTYMQTRVNDTGSQLSMAGRADSMADILGSVAGRTLKATFSAAQRPIEGIIKAGEIVGALSRNELVDTEGNLLDWVDVFKDPEIQIDMDYTSQTTSSLAKKKLRTFTRPEDVTFLLKGSEPKDIRAQKKLEQKIFRHKKYILQPLIKQYAEVCDLLMTKNKIEEAVNMRYELMASINNEYKSTGAAIPQWAVDTFKTEMNRFSAGRQYSTDLKHRVELNDIKGKISD